MGWRDVKDLRHSVANFFRGALSDSKHSGNRTPVDATEEGQARISPTVQVRSVGKNPRPSGAWTPSRVRTVVLARATRRRGDRPLTRFPSYVGTG